MTCVPEPGRNAEIYVLGLHPVADDAADHRAPEKMALLRNAGECAARHPAHLFAAASRLSEELRPSQLASAVDVARENLASK